MQPSLSITPSVRKEIVKIIDARIAESHVTKEDFSELKSIVKDLAEAQKRTEVKVEALAATVKELVVSQKEMQIAIAKLAGGLSETRAEVGGLSRSMSYAFENETYRFLPAILQEKYGLQVQEKIIRAEIGGKEVNLFCRAERQGEPILIVGESKLRLDETRLLKKQSVFLELEEKAAAVRGEYGESEIVKVLVTHFATKNFISRAQEQGVIVVQSHEW